MTLEAASFDLVLTDVHMPGDLSGLDLARIVAQSRPEIKVVVMSGQHVPTEDEPVHFYAFLAKPVLNRPGFAGGSNFQIGWSHDEQNDEQVFP